MKTSLQKLPKRKRDELRIINDMIREIDGVEQIILFGSYARGDWVEELGAYPKTLVECKSYLA